jgi:hypothetical protein
LVQLGFGEAALEDGQLVDELVELLAVESVAARDSKDGAVAVFMAE